MSELQSVRFAAGEETIGGELSATGSRVPVVLIPDVHGISDLYRRLAGRLAAAGHTTLILDLYTREGTPTLRTPEEVGAWIANLPDPRVLGDMRAAVQWLRAECGRTPAVMGFCVGGQYAVMAGCRIAPLAGVISFYGMLRYAERNERKPESPLDMAADLRCPLLGLYGADDPLVPQDDVAALRACLRDAEATFETRTWQNAGHAFLNDQREEAFRPQAAAEAWQEALAFLADLD